MKNLPCALLFFFLFSTAAFAQDEKVDYQFHCDYLSEVSTNIYKALNNRAQKECDLRFPYDNNRRFRIGAVEETKYVLTAIKVTILETIPSSHEYTLLLKSDILEKILKEYTNYFLKKYHKKHDRTYYKKHGKHFVKKESLIFAFERALKLTGDEIFTAFKKELTKNFSDREIALINGHFGNADKLYRKKLKRKYNNLRMNLEASIKYKLKKKLLKEDKI